MAGVVFTKTWLMDGGITTGNVASQIQTREAAGWTFFGFAQELSGNWGLLFFKIVGS